MNSLSIFDNIRNYKKDEPIFNEGDSSFFFYYIIKGSVDIYQTGDDVRTLIKSYHNRSVLGLESFLLNEKRSNDAIARESCEIICVDSSSLEEFCSQLPNAVIRVLDDMSNELRHLNDILLFRNTCSDKCDFSGVLDIVEDEGNVTINNKRMYSKLLPEDHIKYLYDSEKTCPICNQVFRTNQIRSSKLRRIREEPDLRNIYMDIDELWYQFAMCPNCNYINFINTFNNIRPTIITQITEELKNYTYLEPKLVKDNINDVLAEHYHFINMIDSYMYSALVKARVWQSLMWLYSDLNDEESMHKAKDIFKKYLLEGWYEAGDDLDAENEAIITYKVALLSLESGDLKEAYNFMMKALKIPGISSVMKKRIENKLFDISEIKRKSKSDD